MRRAARPRFLCAESAFEPARTVLLGCPFDKTASFRQGARFGPQAMREASDCLETYSPHLDKDLGDAALCDLGDVDFTSERYRKPFWRPSRPRREEIFRAGKRPVFLGGEHLVSFPAVEAALESFPKSGRFPVGRARGFTRKLSGRKTLARLRHAAHPRVGRRRLVSPVRHPLGHAR